LKSQILYLIFAVILLFACSNPIEEIPEGPVGSTFNPNTEHFYIKNETVLTWEEAISWAESYGNSYLVIVNSEDEQQWLSSTFSGDEVFQYWLGLTDEENEGNWKWINGSQLTYANWASDGQPDGSGDYAWCGYGGDYWDDHPVYGNNFHAIAEIEVD